MITKTPLLLLYVLTRLSELRATLGRTFRWQIVTPRGTIPGNATEVMCNKYYEEVE